MFKSAVQACIGSIKYKFQRENALATDFALVCKEFIYNPEVTCHWINFIHFICCILNVCLVHQFAGTVILVKVTKNQDMQLWLPLSSNKETFFLLRVMQYGIDNPLGQYYFVISVDIAQSP